MANTNLIVGLDIGACFVRGVLGAIEDGSVEIFCVSKRPTMGFVRNGAIVNVERMKEVVAGVIDDLEQNFGYEVTDCVSGVGGKYIESINSHGLVPITAVGKRDREIGPGDIDRVIEFASSMMIPPDKELLQIIPRDFIVNGVNGYKMENVIGTQAVRLEVEVLMVTASRTQLLSISQCVEKAGCSLDFVFLKTLAAAKAVMQQEERELGSILIDLGGDTTDAIVIIDDAPACTVSIAAGGKLVTSDIAYMKGISTQVAEDLKIGSGCCWDELLEGNDSEVVIPPVGGKAPELTTRSEICQIIQSRMEEIFTLVRQEIIQKSGLIQLSGCIILTGGGALMNGVVELAQYVFRTNSVRLGIPGKLGGVEETYRTPEYSTAIGLILSDKETLDRDGDGRKGGFGKSARGRKKAASHRSDTSDASEKPRGESFGAKLKRWFF